jgi:hypothetical protein
MTLLKFMILRVGSIMIGQKLKKRMTTMKAHPKALIMVPNGSRILKGPQVSESTLATLVSPSETLL